MKTRNFYFFVEGKKEATGKEYPVELDSDGEDMIVYRTLAGAEAAIRSMVPTGVSPAIWGNLRVSGDSWPDEYVPLLTIRY